MNGRIRTRLISLIEKLDDRRKDCAEFVLGPDARKHSAEELVDECCDVDVLPSLVAIGIQLSGGHPQWKKLQIDLEPRYQSEALLKQRDLVRTHMIQRYSPAVCRVELAGKTLGSGFLVGPNRVITNYHVAKYALTPSAAPIFKKELRFRFDTSHDDIHDDDGVVLSVGVGQKPLAYSKDVDGGLDYVMAELSDASKHPELSKAHIPPVAFSFDGDFTDTRRYAFIIQHPQGQASRIDQGAVTSRFLLNSSHRLLYNIDTDYGSSGSPVILFDGTLLAMHCARGQHYYEQSNVGIFFPRILSDIRATVPNLFASLNILEYPQSSPRSTPCRTQLGDRISEGSFRVGMPSGTGFAASIQSGQDLISHLRGLPKGTLPETWRLFADARGSAIFKVWRSDDAFEIESSPRLVDNDRRNWLHAMDQRFTLRPQETCSWCPKQPTLPPFFQIANVAADNSRCLSISCKAPDSNGELRVSVK